MPPVRAQLLFVVTLLGSGCALWSPVTIARDVGMTGWFRADASLQWQPVDKDTSCEALRAEATGSEAIVLVPGILGDGPEIDTVTRILTRDASPTLFMYRWVPWQERDRIAGDFAAGVSHLLACAPWLEGHLLVLAHSVGGVVVGYGATRIRLPVLEREEPAFRVVTVASPMAGMGDRPPKPDGSSQAVFLFDLGTHLKSYPVAPRSVETVHLRTHFPHDPSMKPTAHHAPNDSGIGIPGARQVDLPTTLTHDHALEFAAERIADGSWRSWFAPDRLSAVGARADTSAAR